MTDNNDTLPLEQRVQLHKAEAWEEARRQAEARFVQSLPPSLRRATWDSVVRDPLTPPEVLEAVSPYIDSPRHNLSLLGDIGVGKTWTAVAAVRRMIAPGQTSLFQPVSEVFELWRGRDWDYRSIGTPYWLILDDLGGAHQLSEREMDRFYAILDKRDRDELPTVVTSNMDPDMLRGWIGVRAFDRLRRGTVVMWPGDSRR